ncbi:MAG: glycosyltransferase family 1 protein [Methanosarcinales archaeon]|nr:MAG: glycosyltransferase family 1 protein [Methanosarcinales archaeon]
MKNRPAILIVQYSSNLDGSAMSALLLADGLLRVGWDTTVAFGFDGPILERFAQNGHKCIVVPHQNWIRRSHLLRFVKDVGVEYRNSRKFVEAFKRLSPKLVYVNSAVSLAAARAARKLGIPCVWHLRELFADVGGEMQAPAPLRRWVSSIFPRLASRLVVNSKAVAQNMLGQRWMEQAEVVYNAVSDRFFEQTEDKEEARKSLGIPLSALLLGVPGTLRLVKGHPFFLNAVGPLLSRYPNLHIAISGDGQPKYAQSLREQAKKLPGAERVHFLGWLQDMEKFYRACDLCCVPSLSESFGRTVIEAFACGIPVIATAVGGIVEIIEEGKTGYLIPYGDEEALRQRLEQLLGKTNLREEMGQKAREQALIHFRESTYQQRLLDVVNAVVR